MKQDTDLSLLDSNTTVNARYRLIMFDFDGTLCHTEAVDVNTIKKVYQKLHQPVPSTDAIRTILGKGLVTKAMFEYLSPEAPSTLLEQFVQSYQVIYLDEADTAELFPDVLTVLQKLKAAHITNIVVSNKPIRLLQAAIESLQLVEYFDKVIGLETNGICKPDPKIYSLYVQHSFPKISRHETLMVGDTRTDLRFAANIHIDVCWARYGGGEPISCEALNPKYTLHQMSDLLNIIPGL